VQSGRFVETFQRKILTPVYHENGGRMFIYTVFESNGEFWFLQQCEGDLSSSVVLRGADWWLTTFQDNIPVPSERAKQSKFLNTGPIGCPETSVPNCRSTLRYIPEE
jgi:hypothetical protein